MSVSFNWVKPQSSGYRASGNEVVVRKVKGGKGSKNPNAAEFAAAIIFPEEVLKRARFVIGDRIIMGFAEDPEKGRMIAVKRVIDGGYKLGLASQPAREGAEKHLGKFARGRVQATWREEFPEGFSSGSGGYEVWEDGTLVIWEGKK